MSFNAIECYIVSAGNRRVPYFYQLNRHVPKYKEINPYLGLLIVESLTFKTHIANITPKASYHLGFFRRNLKGCPEHLKVMTFFAMVQFIVQYLSCVWDPYLKQNITTALSLQW